MVLEHVCNDSTKDCLGGRNGSKLLDSKMAKGFSVPDGSVVADQISCYKWNRYPTGLNKHTDGIAVHSWTQFSYRHIAPNIVLKRFWVVQCLKSGLKRLSYCVKYVMQCFLSVFKTLHPLTFHVGTVLLITLGCANVNSRLAVRVTVKKFCFVVSSYECYLYVGYCFLAWAICGRWC